jgi:para-nitrobenzyl esterase
MFNVDRSTRRRSMDMATAPDVRLEAGALCGSLESDVAVFKGIPFAELPVRFAAPGPVARWDGTREARSFGPPPPQPASLGTDAGGGSADGWLTINVWTPDLAGSRPVLVWIQGGGYLFGHSGRPEYDGSRLARENGVVVVTFNYRVGIEGFAPIEGAPDNRGLLDQVAALEWVRDNIATFGGDRERVTLFGQSAGGGSVAALLAMPRAEGLFRRAIVQSMPGTYFSPELAADITRVLAADLGLEPPALAEIAPSELPAAADALMARADQYAGRWGLAARRRILMAPVVDGVILPTDPWAALRGGASHTVDLIVGHARHEERLFALLEGVLGQVTDDQAATALELFAPLPDGAARYRATGGSPAQLYEDVRSDWLFRMPALHLAEAHTGPTFVYELTWPAPAMDGALGACHGLDVPLVFGNLTSGQPAMLFGEDLAEAEKLSAYIRTAWTNFATNGDPGWPSYGPQSRLTQVFASDPTVVAYPEDASRRIWQDYTFSALPFITRQ